MNGKPASTNRDAHAAAQPQREWKITRSDGGWHDILDTNSILCATVFGVGRARIVCSALAAENGELVREQSDDDLCDPMFTEEMRRGE